MSGNSSSSRHHSSLSSRGGSSGGGLLRYGTSRTSRGSGGGSGHHRSSSSQSIQNRVLGSRYGVSNNSLPPLPDNGGEGGLGSNSSVSAQEVDVSKNPTKLLRLIMYKQYQAAIARLDYHPKEAATWVCLRDKGTNSSYAARHLPIHIACLLIKPQQQASVEPLIKRLIEVYPDSVKGTDNGGKLPIHIACWKGASLYIIALMLRIYPASIHVLDKSKKTPLDYTKSSTAPNRNDVMKALIRVKNGQSGENKSTISTGGSNTKVDRQSSSAPHHLQPSPRDTDSRSRRRSDVGATRSDTGTNTSRSSSRPRRSYSRDRDSYRSRSKSRSVSRSRQRGSRSSTSSSQFDDSRNMIPEDDGTGSVVAADGEESSHKYHHQQQQQQQQQHNHHNQRIKNQDADHAAQSRANVMHAIEAFRKHVQKSDRQLNVSSQQGKLDSLGMMQQEHHNKVTELEGKMKELNEKYFAAKVENTILKKKQSKLMQDAVTYDQECRSLRQTIKTLKRQTRSRGGDNVSVGSGSDRSTTISSSYDGASGEYYDTKYRRPTYARTSNDASLRSSRLSVDEIMGGHEQLPPPGEEEDQLTTSTPLTPYKQKDPTQNNDHAQTHPNKSADTNIKQPNDIPTITTKTLEHKTQQTHLPTSDQPSQLTQKTPIVDTTITDTTTPPSQRHHDHQHDTTIPPTTDNADTTTPPTTDTTTPPINATDTHTTQNPTNTTEDYTISESDKDWTIANLEAQNHALARVIGSQALLIKGIQDGTINPIKRWRYGAVQNVSVDNMVKELRQLIMGDIALAVPVQEHITANRLTIDGGLDDYIHDQDEMDAYWS